MGPLEMLLGGGGEPPNYPHKHPRIENGAAHEGVQIKAICDHDSSRRQAGIYMELTITS